MAADVLRSKGFTRWQRARDAQFKVWTAVTSRLDAITQAIGQLAKVLGRGR